jgi:thiol-disulfide isomerase/thioredoxin
MDDMLQNSELPLLVDFYATWCGPCVMMSRELAELSNDPELKEKYALHPCRPHPPAHLHLE